jgi:hypothetical protein
MKVPTVPVIAALALACAHGTPGTPSPDRAGLTRLVVTNNDFADQVIYAYYLGHRYRLGTVPGLSTAILYLRPQDIPPTNELQLLVHPIGGGQDYLSPVVTLMQGGHPELSIEPSTNNLFLSVMPDPR